MISLTKAPCNLVLEIKSFADSFGWAKRLESDGDKEGTEGWKTTASPLALTVVS